MNRIRELPQVELRKGILRCKARLCGMLPMGWIPNPQVRVREALKEYETELKKRRECK